MDVRKVAERVLGLATQGGQQQQPQDQAMIQGASSQSASDAKKPGARTASDLRDSVPSGVPAHEKRKRPKYEQDLDALLEENINDDNVTQQRDLFQKYVDNVANGELVMTDDDATDQLDEFHDFIQLSKRNIQLVQDYYQMQPYRDAFVGHYTLINARSCKKIKWAKVLDTHKSIQNDLRYREKYGDDSKIENIVKSSSGVAPPPLVPSSQQNGTSKSTTSGKDVLQSSEMGDDLGQFGGIDTMGSNLLMNDAPMGSMMDMENPAAAAPDAAHLAQEQKRKEEEARARQKRILQQQQQRAQRAPASIIVVPAAASSALTLYNAKTFFEEGRFQSTEQVKAQNPKKPKNVVVRHKDARGEMHTYHVVDRVQNLSNSEWSRVVAIFTNGKEWEFKHYKFKNPADMFSKYTGFHLMYDDQPVNSNVQKWPVNVLKISKFKRHLDNPVSKEFWRKIQK